jgi:pimeloyl-ACP methyl ester carboxylesterase
MRSDETPIVLIHGLWMTPRSWDTWAGRFRAAGREVIAPGWPGIDDRSVADIRGNPDPLKGVGIEQIADSYARIIGDLPGRPVIMGHSFGGLITALLADRGLGAAYVAVAPAATAGVNKTPFSTLRTGFPILANPFNKNGAKPLSKGHFHYTFGNDLSRADSDELWEQSAVNSSNRVLFEGVSSARDEKNGVTRVDYARADRAPLLIICGELDHVTPPAIGRATVEKYRSTNSPAIVEYQEFPGRTHRMVSQTGWEEIADAALAWADDHAVPAEPG